MIRCKSKYEADFSVSAVSFFQVHCDILHSSTLMRVVTYFIDITKRISCKSKRVFQWNKDSGWQTLSWWTRNPRDGRCYARGLVPTTTQDSPWRTTSSDWLPWLQQPIILLSFLEFRALYIRYIYASIIHVYQYWINHRSLSLPFVDISV